jgi:DNA-binding GntR family transcriptional regulator
MKQFFTFDRRKKTPIVDQIIEQVIAYINDFKLISGAPLPDIELASKELSLSQAEVNHILQSLTAQGYLRFDKDANTFLIQKPTKDNGFLINISPFFKSIQQQGKTPKVFTLNKKTLTITHELSLQTGFSVGEKVIHYQRYFTADDVPVSFIDFYMSLDKLPQVDSLFKDNQPHLESVMTRYPSQYKYHVRELNVIEAPEFIQTLLSPKEPGMICTIGTYRFYNLSGQVVEAGVSYLTDLTEFTTTSIDLHLLFL